VKGRKMKKGELTPEALHEMLAHIVKHQGQSEDVIIYVKFTYGSHVTHGHKYEHNRIFDGMQTLRKAISAIVAPLSHTDETTEVFMVLCDMKKIDTVRQHAETIAVANDSEVTGFAIKDVSDLYDSFVESLQKYI
jgi:hypothetical protein